MTPKFVLALIAPWLIVSAAQGRDVNKFQTEHSEINHPECLGSWRPYAANASWKCENGRLVAMSAEASLKELLHPFEDGSFRFNITGRSAVVAKGRGETVVWLRNGADGGEMRRVRVVIEEGVNRDTAIRIEQFRQSTGYQRLAGLVIDRYVGRYTVAVQGSVVIVVSEGGTVSASTDIWGVGTTYLFSSEGEGARSTYDNFDLRDNEAFVDSEG